MAQTWTFKACRGVDIRALATVAAIDAWVDYASSSSSSTRWQLLLLLRLLWSGAVLLLFRNVKDGRPCPWWRKHFA